jgi:hypothetical protein
MPFDGIGLSILSPLSLPNPSTALLPPTAHSGRIAFLVVADCGFRQTKIWQRFFDGHESKFSLYMVRRFPRRCTKGFTNANVRYLSNRHGSDYGGLGYIKTSMALMRAALDDNIMQNERFVILSESDIPVISFPRIYQYVMEDSYSWMHVHFPSSPRNDLDSSNAASFRWSAMSRHRIKWNQYGKYAAQGNVMTRSFVEKVLMHDYFLTDFAPDADAIKEHRIMQAVDEHFFVYALVASKSAMTVRMRRPMYFDWSKSHGSSPSAFKTVDRAFLDAVRRPEFGHMFMRKVTSNTSFTVSMTDLLIDSQMLLPPIRTIALPP